MPLNLKRRDGSVTPFRNSEYLPFYYFIPKNILQKCGVELNAIPRNPQMVFTNYKACEFIESDLFRLLIIDAAAYLVWKYMGFDEYMEVYSGYDPAWKLAHQPEYWINELTQEGIIPTLEVLCQTIDYDIGFTPDYDLTIYLRYIVPRVMKKYNMYAVLETAEEYRCFEDYDYRESKQKIDFYRQWYHTRTKHPTISLEAFQEDYAASHSGQQWDMADDSQDLELYTTSQIVVDEFMATIGEVDKQILEMRLEGKTLEEIAAALGYKSHSAVQKRIKKVGLKYQKFSGMDLGFDE